MMKCKLLLISGALLTLVKPSWSFLSRSDYSLDRKSFARRRLALRPAKEKQQDEKDNNIQLVVDAVSDEEALLACRAYLQRKNKLVWTEHEERKRHAKQASAMSSSRYGAAGFFWEEPSELKYMTNRPPHLQDHIIEDEFLEDEEEEETHHQRVVFDESHSLTDENGAGVMDRSGEFTSFPVVRPEVSERRSKAAKKTWSDPEWKVKWYEKRWGGERRKQSSKRKKLSDRMKSLPPNVLDSPEMASLTEEEISEAIQTYLSSKQKRSRYGKSHKETDKTTRPLIESFGSEEAMKEAQRKRSERSAKAYQTRLKNQEKETKPQKRTRQPEKVPSSDSPRDAAMRIQNDLEGSRLPSTDDVDILLQPRKLGGRKELLRRILNEHFDLRGKCIPSGEDEEKLIFVTQCSIEELGGFVLSKMKEKHKLE